MKMNKVHKFWDIDKNGIQIIVAPNSYNADAAIIKT